MFLMSFEMDNGGLFLPDMFRRLRMTLLNFESVRRPKNLYSLKQPHIRVLGLSHANLVL